ncbi:MAG: ATP-binding protein [Ruminococcus sp.]
MTPREEIGYGLDALVIFRSLQHDPVIRALMQFCHTDSGNTPAQIRFYSAMTAALYEQQDDLTSYMEQIVLEHENVYVQRAGAGEPISPNMEACLHTELKLLGRIAMLSPAQMQAEMQTSIPLPSWQTHKTDLDAMYSKRVANIERHGYGIYARHHMFTVGAGGELIPVQYPDPISLNNMVGYERERSIVVENTKALLDGKYASNVLLSGDAGTGKSATVKAIANAFKCDGLRLIELNKDQLCYIPQIMDHLCKNPLKFILFIDDLTFSEDDPNFGTLKATLEGSIAARMKNTVIYATSNRRHLVKETFDDGSDKHSNDTVQERISLSERFGITITYSRPQKDLYLEIVHALAQQAGLHMSQQELDARAEQFALQKSGRSARAARQLVDQLLTQNE